VLRTRTALDLRALPCHEINVGDGETRPLRIKVHIAIMIARALKVLSGAVNP